MAIIDRIITRARKISGTADKAARMERLILEAYAAGRQDAIKDVVITLQDDMITERHLNHLDAVDMIQANSH
jgi:hypothetical protein